MATKTSYFLVGLFVFLGLVLGTVLIIWVGASRYFEPGRKYVTFFDESVQGLQKDSIVKYRGVDVGRVEQIRVAPDNRLIEVVMKIELTEDIRKGMAAELKTAGITGIVFVELARIDPGEKVTSPKITFATEHPVIPSRTSTMQRIFAKIEEMVEKFKDVDFAGVSDQAKAAGMAAERFFDGPRTRTLLDNLERASRRVDETIVRVDNVLSGDLEAAGRLIAKIEKDFDGAQIPDRSMEAKEVLAEARALLAEARRELKEMRLTETGQAAARIAEELEGQQQAMAPALRETMENLRRTSDELKSLIERLRAAPSEVIFGQPPPRRQ
ncbi:MAG: Mammalian cell entry related domain protein [Actinobacteria bacterium]|nr:Mammalian cell entry related domain protein [Actinomycetota bacterium]MBM2827995.1 Mammalian cell entry related domain protein [Actinomycetota bacterium]